MVINESVYLCFGNALDQALEEDFSPVVNTLSLCSTNATYFST